jgi:hypothetical protein
LSLLKKLAQSISTFSLPVKRAVTAFMYVLVLFLFMTL